MTRISVEFELIYLGEPAPPPWTERTFVLPAEQQEALAFAQMAVSNVDNGIWDEVILSLPAQALAVIKYREKPIDTDSTPVL